MSNTFLQQNPKPKHDRIFKSKKLLIAGGIVVTIIFAISGIWIYNAINQRQPDSTQVDLESQQAIDSSNRVFSTNDEASQLILNGGSISEASAIYDDAIQAESDSTTKISLILSQATMYFNNDEYDKALSLANQAEAIAESSGLDAFIAQIYEKKGDTVNAMKYYQKAIDVIDNNDPLAGADVEYYQTIIDNLNSEKS